ncbi:transposase, partial [Pseudomonas aeruginosa]
MPPQRRTYSKSFKAQVIQECSEPGASIANIALGYSLNANLVHKWIRLHTQKTTAIQPAFIPLPSQMLGAGAARGRFWPTCTGDLDRHHGRPDR